MITVTRVSQVDRDVISRSRANFFEYVYTLTVFQMFFLFFIYIYI